MKLTLRRSCKFRRCLLLELLRLELFSLLFGLTSPFSSAPSSKTCSRSASGKAASKGATPPSAASLSCISKSITPRRASFLVTFVRKQSLATLRAKRCNKEIHFFEVKCPQAKVVELEVEAEVEQEEDGFEDKDDVICERVPISTR